MSKKTTELSAISGSAALTDLVALVDVSTGDSVKAVLSKIVELCYPVGAVFISAVSTSPATLLGFGTWSRIAEGRALVGVDTADPSWDDAGVQTGAKTVAAAGTNSAPTFTGSALAGHSHGAGTYGADATSGGTPSGSISWPAGVPTFTGSALGTHSHGVGSYAGAATSAGTPAGTVSQPTFTGNAVAAASTNATPDLVTSNTAGSGVSPVTTATGTVSQPTFTGSALGTHSHTFSGTSEAVTAGTPAGSVAWPAGVPTFSGSALGTHTHTLSGSSQSVSAGTPAGTVSAPTFTGSATSVVQPSEAYYIWKRTA